MATTPEQAFYHWIQRKLSKKWFLQRIETTTGTGIPDIIAISEGYTIFIETKAVAKTNVQIRKSQYAWIMRSAKFGVSTWIMNRDPKWPHQIQAWNCLFDVELGRKEHLKLVSEPNRIIEASTFHLLDIRSFTPNVVNSHDK